MIRENRGDGIAKTPMVSTFTRSLKRIMPGMMAAAVILGAMLIFLAPSQTVMVVQAAITGKTVLCAPMAEGEEWIISYTHSVNRRPVQDVLRIEGRGFRILRSRFDAFGAGMPETSTTENPLRIGTDGWIEYTVNRPVPEVTIFVGRVAQHAVHFRGREIPFTSLAEPGTALRFTVEKRSRYQTFKGRCVW